MSGEDVSTQLQDACYRGDVQEAEKLIAIGALNCAPDDLVHLATFSTRSTIIEVLLRHGMDINSKDKHGYTPLLFMCNHGRGRSIRPLVALGADLEAVDRVGNTPLLQAIICGHVKVVKELLDLGANVNAKNFNGEGVLHVVAASRAANPEILTLLLQRGSDMEATDREKRTPLHLAIVQGDLNALELLLVAGADLQGCDEDGNSPLHLSVSAGRIETTAMVLKYGADINAVNHAGCTPLHTAAARGKSDVVAMLVAHKANVAHRNSKGRTALEVAEMYGNIEVVNLLLCGFIATSLRLGRWLDFLQYIDHPTHASAVLSAVPDIVNLTRPPPDVARATEQKLLRSALYSPQPETARACVIALEKLGSLLPQLSLSEWRKADLSKWMRRVGCSPEEHPRTHAWLARDPVHRILQSGEGASDLRRMLTTDGDDPDRPLSPTAARKRGHRTFADMLAVAPKAIVDGCEHLSNLAHGQYRVGDAVYEATGEPVEYNSVRATDTASGRRVCLQFFTDMELMNSFTHLSRSLVMPTLSDATAAPAAAAAKAFAAAAAGGQASDESDKADADTVSEPNSDTQTPYDAITDQSAADDMSTITDKETNERHGATEGAGRKQKQGGEKDPDRAAAAAAAVAVGERFRPPVARVLRFFHARPQEPWRWWDIAGFAVVGESEGTLSDYLEELPSDVVPLSEANAILDRVLECIGVLRSKGYVHGGIHPSYIVREADTWSLRLSPRTRHVSKGVPRTSRGVCYRRSFIAPETRPPPSKASSLILHADANTRASSSRGTARDDSSGALPDGWLTGDLLDIHDGADNGDECGCGAAGEGPTERQAWQAEAEDVWSIGILMLRLSLRRRHLGAATETLLYEPRCLSTPEIHDLIQLSRGGVRGRAFLKRMLDPNPRRRLPLMRLLQLRQLLTTCRTITVGATLGAPLSPSRSLLHRMIDATRVRTGLRIPALFCILPTATSGLDWSTAETWNDTTFELHWLCDADIWHFVDDNSGHPVGVRKPHRFMHMVAPVVAAVLHVLQEQQQFIVDARGDVDTVGAQEQDPVTSREKRMSAAETLASVDEIRKKYADRCRAVPEDASHILAPQPIEKSGEGTGAQHVVHLVKEEGDVSFGFSMTAGPSVGVVITRIVKDLPADRAGVPLGASIVEVDGVDVRSLSANTIVSLMEGKPSVDLLIEDPFVPEPLPEETADNSSMDLSTLIRHIIDTYNIALPGRFNSPLDLPHDQITAMFIQALSFYQQYLEDEDVVPRRVRKASLSFEEAIGDRIPLEPIRDHNGTIRFVCHEHALEARRGCPFDFAAEKEWAAIQIQRIVRGFLARRRVHKMKNNRLIDTETWFEGLPEKTRKKSIAHMQRHSVAYSEVRPGTGIAPASPFSAPVVEDATGQKWMKADDVMRLLQEQQSFHDSQSPAAQFPGRASIGTPTPANSGTNQPASGPRLTSTCAVM
eukprot:Rmarinus@m.17781